jgi:hypothetical protein
MKLKVYLSFDEAIREAKSMLQFYSAKVHSKHWQGVDISSKPDMAMYESLHLGFSVVLDGEDLRDYRADIQPNLPWADDHFEERVCGAPINPGVQWTRWPYGHSASKFLDANGQFNHNYMERYWPKQAGKVDVATTHADTFKDLVDPIGVNCGIRYDYGDLDDVVELLVRDPLTRQAYLPVWFPEDTGGGDKRAPCTIGYHFMMRNERLYVDYHIRSCDFVRHFRDDLYLTVRLLLWVLDRCREKNSMWWGVKPGKFIMVIDSLHMFANDYSQMFGGPRK